MLHIEVSRITSDPRRMDDAISYLASEVRPVMDRRPGSLGTSVRRAGGTVTREDLLKAAPPAETYKPGQVVPRDGTVECARHHDVQDHVKAGTRFAPCSHHHEHSEGCTWQYVV
jgi:hypothetical protein